MKVYNTIWSEDCRENAYVYDGGKGNVLATNCSEEFELMLKVSTYFRYSGVDKDGRYLEGDYPVRRRVSAYKSLLVTA